VVKEAVKQVKATASPLQALAMAFAMVLSVPLLLVLLVLLSVLSKVLSYLGAEMNWQRSQRTLLVLTAVA